MISITPLALSRFDEIWPIIEEVVRPGDTFSLPRDLTRDEAMRIWSSPGRQIYAAFSSGVPVGTYYLQPNQLGPGSHVANAGYMTAKPARGQGVARAMCQHSINEARRLGYEAMQFNCVVSTNNVAVDLWRSFEFEVVGRFPRAFRMSDGAFVDTFVMRRDL